MNQVELIDIGPLDIVEEDHQRDPFGSEGLNKTVDKRVESVTGLGGAENRRWGLVPNDAFQVRNQIEQNLSAWSQGPTQFGSPFFDFGIAFKKDPGGQFLESP